MPCGRCSACRMAWCSSYRKHTEMYFEWKVQIAARANGEATTRTSRSQMRSGETATSSDSGRHASIASRNSYSSVRNRLFVIRGNICGIKGDAAGKFRQQCHLRTQLHVQEDELKDHKYQKEVHDQVGSTSNAESIGEGGCTSRTQNKKHGEAAGQNHAYRHKPYFSEV